MGRERGSKRTYRHSTYLQRSKVILFVEGGRERERVLGFGSGGGRECCLDLGLRDKREIFVRVGEREGSRGNKVRN